VDHHHHHHHHHHVDHSDEAACQGPRNDDAADFGCESTATTSDSDSDDMADALQRIKSIASSGSAVKVNADAVDTGVEWVAVSEGSPWVAIPDSDNDFCEYSTDAFIIFLSLAFFLFSLALSFAGTQHTDSVPFACVNQTTTTPSQALQRGSWMILDRAIQLPVPRPLQLWLLPEGLWNDGSGST
jgi:hypothetical protein